MSPRKLIAHGYVLASADMRGTGASFGTWSECSDPMSSLDGYDITEWLAAQPWCDGTVGMFGASYEGRMQLNTASAAPPHLKAIMPEVSPFDWYEIIHEGGIYQRSFDGMGDGFRTNDVDAPAAPVDDDHDGWQVAQASKEHEQGNDYAATKGKLPFRDSENEKGVAQWLERSGEALLAGIVSSGVASYHTSGLLARVGLDQLLWFGNLARSATGNRHRIWMGPWGAGGVVFAEPEYKEIGPPRRCASSTTGSKASTTGSWTSLLSCTAPRCRPTTAATSSGALCRAGRHPMFKRLTSISCPVPRARSLR